MLGSFLIFFRESLEASLICSIMLAYLSRVGRRDRFRDVLYGVAAAVIAAGAAGVAVFMTVRMYAGSTLQTVIESITYVAAAAMLSYMTIWMKRQSRELHRHLERRMDAALSAGAGVTLGLIAFLTVGREGLETVIFMLAIAYHANPGMLAVGAAAGALCGLSLSYVIYVAGRRINLKHFFNVMGALLMLFSAGLLANAVEDWQGLGWIPFASRPLWNTTVLLNENGTLGDIMHSFFGYADSPSVLQVSTYVLYLAIMIAVYQRLGRSPGSSERRAVNDVKS